MKVVLGDFNDKVGEEQHFLGTTSRHSLHSDTYYSVMNTIITKQPGGYKTELQDTKSSNIRGIRSTRVADINRSAKI